MQLSDADVVAFAVGGVAVVFSGFVLSYSAGGGLAMVAAGALALALPFLRDGDGSWTLGALGWLAVVALLVAGVGGFLVGFGVFDEPDVRPAAEGELYDAGGEPVVVVTGNVTNAGDATAHDVVVTATLLDAEGEAIRRDSRRLAPLAPGTTQLFYLRFEGGDEMSRFDDVEVDVNVSR